MEYNFDCAVDRRRTDSLKWDSADAQVLPMWVADMDFPVAPQIQEVLTQRVGHGVYGYGKVPAEHFEAAVSWELRRYGWAPKAEWCLHTPGVVAGLHFAVRALLARGEKAIALMPVYYPFYDAARRNGIELVKSPLIYDGGRYQIDFEDFEQKAADSSVKLLLLCSPHNPGGRVWSRDELTRLANICKKYDVLIVSDEVHCDLCLNGNRHTPTASLSEDASRRCVTFIAPSKTFNLAGLQTAVAIIEDPELRRRFAETVSCAGISRPNIFGIAATRVAYTQCDDWLEAAVQYIEDNVGFLMRYGQDHLQELRFMAPDAGYLVWFDCSRLGVQAEEFHQLLLDKGRLWLDEGYLFGEEGRGFERINVACPRATLEEGLKRLSQTVDYVKNRC